MAPARYFDAAHDDGGSFPGVPKADIDEETFKSYPEWLQASIDAHPMYRKTKPKSDSDTKTPDKKDGD